MSKYKVISADSHVVEPGDLWTKYTAKEFRERAPKLVREKDGSDTFVIDGQPLVRPAAFSVAGREAALGTAMTFEDVYKGGYDPDARLKDMAKDGVEAEVVYPSVTMRIYAIPDLALKQACFEAYNMWAADFSAKQPERLKALAVVTVEDIESAVSEMHRAKKAGLVGVMVSISSNDPNLYTQTKYDPFWATAQDLDMPVVQEEDSGAHLLWVRCPSCQEIKPIEVSADKAGSHAGEKSGETIARRIVRHYRAGERFLPGEWIYHPEWDDTGQVIEKIRSTGGRDIIVVSFQRIGTKRLICNFAR